MDSRFRGNDGGEEGITALSAAGNLRMVAPTTAWDMAQSLVVNYLAGLKQGRR